MLCSVTKRKKKERKPYKNEVINKTHEFFGNKCKIINVFMY